jgi:hypothetical protein
MSREIDLERTMDPAVNIDNHIISNVQTDITHDPRRFIGRSNPYLSASSCSSRRWLEWFNV